MCVFVGVALEIDYYKVYRQDRTHISYYVAKFAISDEKPFTVFSWCWYKGASVLTLP